jgi:hypothetical protein
VGRRGPKPSCECGVCKKCRQREYQRRRYQDDPEAIKAIIRRNIKKYPERRKAVQKRANAARDHVAAGKKRRLTEPDFFLKDKARNVIENLIARGRLVRQPCEVCGAEPSQAHHDDYTNPKEVRWLCTTHHAEAHHS